MKTLIDADSILFKAACTNWKDINDRDHHVKKRIKEVVNSIHSDCWSSEMLFAVKGKGNFRYDIYPDYKKSRKDREMEERLRDRLNMSYFYLKEKYNAIPADGMEADDLVSIWAHEARQAEEDFIVAHIDKDLNQIPGNHYNYNKKDIYFVNDDEADMNFCIQLIIGDSGDDIPQLKRGVGIKTAQKLLKGTTYDNRIDKVVSIYRDHLGSKFASQLSLVGNLIYMKRTFELEEWNYEDRYTRKANVSQQDDKLQDSSRSEMANEVSNS